MPGKVLQLLVTPGSPVEAGTPLLILEAMKMEHQVVSPADGVLNGYPVHEGQRVMPGDLLADFSPGIG
jgi:biotin carboxyl carrier protein